MKKENYSCPMHPEVVGKKGETCPKCGMALVAKDEEDHGSDEEGGHDHTSHHAMMAEDFKRRFFVVLPLTIIVLILSPEVAKWLNFSVDFIYKNFIIFLFSLVIVGYGGAPFFRAAFAEIKSKNWGMMTLVSLGITAGFLFSVGATFFFPGVSFYWEVSTLVLVFLFGHFLEMRAVIGAGGALRELASVIPPMAHLLRGSEIVMVKTASLKKGDLVVVKPGEKVPADGVVTEGESSLNESIVTGESTPILKKEGDEVIGGSLNGNGSLTIKITKVGKDSALSQIMDLVRGAQETKPAVQRLADRAAHYLTLIAIVAGFSTFIFWFFINPQGAVFAATLAITVVVITCPHALGLAIPTVTTISTALAAKNGILIRNMEGLEAAREATYVVFDKTGTLTEGNFAISKIIGGSEVLKLAASLEAYSEHAIGRGIVEEAKKKGLSLSKISNFKAVKGKGASAKVGGSPVLLGSASFLKGEGIEIKEEKSLGTAVYVAKNKKYLGAIFLEDKLRKDSKKAVEALHSMGVKVALLSGDKKEVVEKVGLALGIDTVFAEVLPSDKIKKVRQLQKNGDKVVMVGDGINDAPALTQANLGIAIGAGTSVAIESAEIVLVKSNPMDIVSVFKLARKTDAKMKQNLVWATGYNLLAIPAAAGAFLPWGFSLRPQWGALIMSVSSVIVVANALLLKRAKL